MSKDTYYFSHDYNARVDEKIELLLMKHGWMGYGLYWAIIENLYNNANALQTNYERIAFSLQTDKDIIYSIVNEFELFVVNDGFFGSISVERRLNERNCKSIKARESANKRWHNSKNDANALPSDCERNAIKEIKVKESKVKESVYEFEHFWNDYDKKTDKAKTQKKYAMIKEEDRIKIKDYLPKYKLSKPEKKYRKDPYSFLLNQSWENEIVDDIYKSQTTQQAQPNIISPTYKRLD